MRQESKDTRDPRLSDMDNNSARFKVTLKCHATGGEFDVWVGDEAEVPAMADKLKASVVEVRRSSDAELVLAQFMALTGMKPQLRMP